MKTIFFQVAARNCRKRKIDQIKQLEDDVTRIRCRKSKLVAEHEKLQGQRRQWTDIVKTLHDHVLKVNEVIRCLKHCNNVLCGCNECRMVITCSTFCRQLLV